MKLRLALVSAPVSLSERYGRFAGAANTEPSFGLVCLGAVARDAGADVHIVEASSEDLSVDQTLERVLGYAPDVVGITATTVGITAAGTLAEKLKGANRDIIILVGGPHATALPKDTLDRFPGFDLVVMREGEKTLIALLHRISDENKTPTGIDGTAERFGGEVRVNPPRPFIADLDELPLPAWSLLKGFPKAFHPSPARIKRWPCASVVLTRGCPNTCTFCDRSVFGNKCRAYSPAYAVRLVKDLRDRYGVRELLIEDDTFIIVKARVAEFCQRIIQEGVDITWSCLGRADRVDLDLLKLMKRAGCWHISYGIESGDPAILKSVKKNLNVEAIRRGVHWTREAGIESKGFFMTGFPGESEASLAATRELAMSLPLDDISIMQLTPFPGSELFASAERYGKFDCDWGRMNTLDTVFVPNGLSRDQLESARRRMLRAFYLRPRIMMRKLLRSITNPRLALHMFHGFLSLLKI